MATRCPKCHHENPDDTIYCGKCAKRLQPSKDIGVTKTIETPAEEYPRGSTFADRYKIIEKLGIGGMGAVYRVEDTNLKCTLIELNIEELLRFLLTQDLPRDIIISI